MDVENRLHLQEMNEHMRRIADTLERLLKISEMSL